jgi:hypothetical protein
VLGRFVLAIVALWPLVAEAARFAIVSPDGKVKSVVEAATAADVIPPPGGQVVELMSDSPVATHYTYDGTAFTPPPVPTSALIERKLDAALDANLAYLALNPPTTAQALAQVGALTRQVNGILRLMRNRLDSAE